MSLKYILDNDFGLTYTLEAIIGIGLIMAAIIFVTGNLPYATHETGEYSKVQLMNIGRDVLDLIEITPISDTDSTYWSSLVYRNYTLVADKEFATPEENVTFTVYYMGTDEIVYTNLTLMKKTLGLEEESNMGIINGSAMEKFTSSGEYSIIAKDLTSWSNSITIYVGYYFLDTDINGISSNGSKIVDGVVYNSSGYGISNLDIEILDSDFTLVHPPPPPNPITSTMYGTIMENFDNINNWTSDRNLTLNNTIKTQGVNSITLNGSSTSFWIKSSRSTVYALNYYDILSFDFFSRNKGEKIDIELSNKTISSNKFIWNNISVNNLGWNKINFKLKYPDEIEGNITAGSIDTIYIKASNVTNQDYLIDNLTAGYGNFSFNWVGNKIETRGSYYIQAKDGSGNTSNRHRIVYSDKGLLYSDKYTIWETESTNITLIPSQGGLQDLSPLNNFNINLEDYGPHYDNRINLVLYPDETKVKLTANTAGDYYIFYGESGGQDNANAIKTNSILIEVLPLDSTNGMIKDSFFCSAFNSSQLNSYLNSSMIPPPYVNYNIYLINANGTVCLDCQEFKEVINGYPTDEAVTVSKLIHLDKQKDLGSIKELRIVLWYK